jgi:hypothetical protein
MTVGRRILGLLVLCTLALGLCAAQATAATNGTTAFTCKETGSGGFTKAHCAATDAGAGKFSHVAIPQDTKTEVTGSNEKTGAPETVGSKVAEIETPATTVGIFFFEATGVSLTGTLTNKVVAGEHRVEGTVTMTLTGATAASPAGCKIKGGKIESAPLILTTAGQGMEVKLSPLEGTKFLEFTTEGCPVEALNTKGTVTGSVKGKLDGATLNLSKGETGAAKTLNLPGPMAVGLGASITLSGKAGEDKAFTPLSFTTVET